VSTPFLGELRIFSFNFPPKGWAMANGQLLPINQNQALFALLGTTYGGDGVHTFALPNLQGRVPMSFGTGFVLGQRSGEQFHTLITGELPAHTHPLNATANLGSVTTPVNNLLATPGGADPYGAGANSNLAANSLTATGGGQPHENRQPFLTLTICIALSGIFPSQN